MKMRYYWNRIALGTGQFADLGLRMDGNGVARIYPFALRAWQLLLVVFTYELGRTIGSILSATVPSSSIFCFGYL
jgi:hypothetical protein